MSSFLSDGNFTPSWTDSERSLLASLSKEHQSVVQQHIQRYTDQIFQHVTNKLLADTTLDSDKLWQRATEKIRLARTKVLAQVGGTPPIKSAPVSTTATTATTTATHRVGRHVQHILGAHRVESSGRCWKKMLLRHHQHALKDIGDIAGVEGVMAFFRRGP